MGRKKLEQGLWGGKLPKKIPQTFGIPTKYDYKMPEKLMEYFKGKIESGEVPTFHGFMGNIANIGATTFKAWQVKYKPFKIACDICRQILADNIINGAIKDRYSQAMSKMVLQNLDNSYCEKSQIESTTIEVGQTWQQYAEERERNQNNEV